MRSALAQGAVGVVWVTLRDTNPLYHATNGVIEKAAERWPQLAVADWNAYSAGRPWFGADGLHLNAAGATALASFLRPYVLRAAALGG
jgi:lysophospholipase L1-like esterase